MKVRDYLRSHEAHLWSEGSDTRVRVNGVDIVIQSLPSQEIRCLLNQAVAQMLVRLERNLAQSPLKFEQKLLERIALQVALHNLYLFTRWNRFLPRHLERSGPLQAQELLRHNVPEQVLGVCEKVFGADGPQYAAALLGYSEPEWRRWEQGRAPSRMCTNNSRYRVS